MHEGVFTPFGTTHAEAEEMIMAARLAVGWVTEEDLASGEETEDDAAEAQDQAEA